MHGGAAVGGGRVDDLLEWGWGGCGCGDEGGSIILRSLYSFLFSFFVSSSQVLAAQAM